MQAQQDQKVQEKKPYVRPTLTTHGDAQSLTQLLPIGGSGIPGNNGD